MSSKNYSEDIIDLTEVVKVGEGAGVPTKPLNSEDDVLDSLVSEFEESGSSSEPKKADDDDVLDLTNLDSLISSYNLNEDENSSENSPLPENETLDEDFDAILNNIKDEISTENAETQASQEIDFETNSDSGIFNLDETETNLINTDETESANSGTESIDLPDFDLDDIKNSLDSDEMSLSNDSALPEDDEIELLTKDIINGTQKETKEDNETHASFEDELEQSFNEIHSANSTEQTQNSTDDILDLSNEQLAEVEGSSDIFSMDTASEKAKMESIQLDIDSFDAETKHKSPILQKLNSLEEEITTQEQERSAEEAQNDIAVDDAEFANILAEVSLEHDNEELQEEDVIKDEPIHLSGDINFIESSTKQEKNDDLVQSANKILDSNEAFLEKFDGQDDSVGGKLKSMSANMASLQQKIENSDSKWQDTCLEINTRIGLVENRVAELEINAQAEIQNLKNSLSVFQNSLQELENSQVNSTNEASTCESNVADFLEKIAHIESRIEKLDEIFAEQKMLNDELSKTLDSSAGDVNSSAKILELENQIDDLSSQLSTANTKISLLEENLEQMVSAAAAKVLREEIIPLLSK